MAKTPQSKSASGGWLQRLPLGSKLIGLGVALFGLTRLIKWFPLGLLGSWINGILWPILLLSIVAGGALTYRSSQRKAGS